MAAMHHATIGTSSPTYSGIIAKYDIGKQNHGYSGSWHMHHGSDRPSWVGGAFSPGKTPSYQEASDEAEDVGRNERGRRGLQSVNRYEHLLRHPERGGGTPSIKDWKVWSLSEIFEGLGVGVTSLGMLGGGWIIKHQRQ